MTDDVLDELEYPRRAGITQDGLWLLDVRYPGQMPVKIDAEVGQPSRWITLHALRVLHVFASGG